MFRTLQSLVIAIALSLTAGANDYYNFIRQQQQQTKVVWDMPVVPKGAGPAALLIEESGALFQLWTIQQKTAADYLLDQKLVGAYLPKGSITIRTLDSYNGIPRIRVDQPFSVDFNVSNLLFGPNIPPSASRVIVEHHLAPNLNGSLSITPSQAISGTPFTSGLIEKNGLTTLNFGASSIKAPDPTKARGEEHFVLHALGDGVITQTRIATAFLQVWPIASGVLDGIKEGETLRGTPPNITVTLSDLYPRSDTYVRIFSTGKELGSEGEILPGSRLVLDQGLPENRNITISEYEKLFDSDGPYRIELYTQTPFGIDRLDTIHFKVNRTLRVHAMQIDGELSAK